MKIGILTFHCAINYGAVLQAYGLQEYLKNIGHDVYIIDYRPDYLLYPYRVFRWNDSPPKFKDKVLWFIRELLVIIIRLKRKYEFESFTKKYLNLCKLDLNNSVNDFDAFVFGSDQIWNKTITKGDDKVFWGDFPASKGKKLIAYAASMGDMLPHLEDVGIIKKRLERFDLIGVRELAMSDYLHSCQIPCSVVVDPVLLAGPKIYKDLIMPKNHRADCPYMLLFTLGRDEYVIPIAQKIASLLHLQIIEIISSKESIDIKNSRQTLNPADFLSYIYNASYIVTSSFHGTAFSILFEKNFTVVKQNGMKSNRIESLLEITNLTSRLVIEEGIIDTSPIDYECRREKLESINKFSCEFWINT